MVCPCQFGIPEYRQRAVTLSRYCVCAVSANRSSCLQEIDETTPDDFIATIAGAHGRDNIHNQVLMIKE